MSNKQIRAMMNLAFGRRRYTAYRMRHVEGMSLREISQITERHPSNVCRDIKFVEQAIKRMRKEGEDG